jgi:hypothetical protein
MPSVSHNNGAKIGYRGKSTSKFEEFFHLHYKWHEWFEPHQPLPYEYTDEIDLCLRNLNVDRNEPLTFIRVTNPKTTIT